MRQHFYRNEINSEFEIKITLKQLGTKGKNALFL